MVDGGATLRRIAAGRGAGPRPMREGGEEEEALALEDLPDFAFHRIFAKVGHGGACALAICCRKLLARVLEEKVWEVSTAYCSRHRAERETDLDPQDLYVQRFGPDPPEPSPGSAPHASSTSWGGSSSSTMVPMMFSPLIGSEKWKHKLLHGWRQHRQ